MPFKSEKQRRYLWANEPKIAREFAEAEKKMKYSKAGDKFTKRWKVRSGRIVLGVVTQIGQVYGWEAKSAGVFRDSGVTDSLENAGRLILKACGMSPRQYEMSIREG